uniref:ABC transmembrane type-1 domain-containing protein n=1 Tax=Anopheles farauti TaxID=69004 RepID=A0A182QRJ5_9DIPT
MLRIGARRQIVPGDIYEGLPAHGSAHIGATFSQQWERDAFRRGSIDKSGEHRSRASDTKPEGQPAAPQNKRPAPWRLLRTVVRIYGTGVLVFGFVYSSIESACRIGQPFLLGQLILYFDAQRQATESTVESDTSLGAAYGYAVGIVMTVMAPLAIFHCYQLYMLQILRLSNTTDGLSGTVINLMANDVSRFDYAVIFFHDLWKGPVELVIVAVLVYREIGPAGLIGIGFLLLFIPIQAWLGKKSAAYRMSTALATDERVRLTNEIVHGIQVIKMYVWEHPFEQIVSKLRRKEIQALRGSAIIKSALFALRIIPKVSIFLTLVAYVYFDNALTARRVYMLISFFSVIHHSMVEFWPLAVTSAAEGWISLKRIQEFLLQDNVRYQSGEKENNPTRSKENAPAFVEFIGVSTTWPDSSFSIEGVYCKIDAVSHRTVAIVGTIGAGKSTLLNLILGEQPTTAGKVLVHGVLSYCSQKP